MPDLTSLLVSDSERAAFGNGGVVFPDSFHLGEADRYPTAPDQLVLIRHFSYAAGRRPAPAAERGGKRPHADSRLRSLQAQPRPTRCGTDS
jgi:hypothetical protein